MPISSGDEVMAMIRTPMGNPCDSARESFSAGLDGEASELELRSAERHRQTCETCRAFAESATRTTSRVRGARPLVPPLTFAPPRRSSPVRRWTATVGAVASLAAMAMLGVFVSEQTHQPASRHASAPMKVALLSPNVLQAEKIQMHQPLPPIDPELLRGGSLG
jgi:predicted anti-sigma-YlaC factor YlaD